MQLLKADQKTMDSRNADVSLTHDVMTPSAKRKGRFIGDRKI